MDTRTYNRLVATLTSVACYDKTLEDDLHLYCEVVDKAGNRYKLIWAITEWTQLLKWEGRASMLQDASSQRELTEGEEYELREIERLTTLAHTKALACDWEHPLSIEMVDSPLP